MLQRWMRHLLTQPAFSQGRLRLQPTCRAALHVKVDGRDGAMLDLKCEFLYQAVGAEWTVDTVGLLLQVCPPAIFEHGLLVPLEAGAASDSVFEIVRRWQVKARQVDWSRELKSMVVKMKTDQKLEEAVQVPWDSYVVCGRKCLPSILQLENWTVEIRSMSLVG